MSDRVAAIVVTYNRKELLRKCIDGVLRQTRPVDALFIIDNKSTDGTFEYLRQLSFVSGDLQVAQDSVRTVWWIPSRHDSTKRAQVVYIQLNENSGSAGGFHEGIKAAYQAGYDWVWLMDDDGRATPDCLERMTTSRYLKQEVCLNSLVIDPTVGKLSFEIPDMDKYNTFFDVYRKTDDPTHLARFGDVYPWGIFFNSTLLSRLTIERVGLPRAEFFIWGDEVEYIFRIRRAGINILTVLDSVFYHPKDGQIPPPAWKLKYFFRNYAYIYWRYRKFGSVKVGRLLASALRHRRFYLLRPIYHGLIGDFSHGYRSTER